MKKVVVTILACALLAGLAALVFSKCQGEWCQFFKWQKTRAVTNFDECAAAGFPVMESYPRQCRAGDQLFVEEIDPALGFSTYESEKFGFRFQYSQTYMLLEKELGDGHRGHFSITLIEDTEENRMVLEGKAPGRDGPVAITIDLYQSPDQSTSLLWVKENPASNFHLSNGTTEEGTVGGKPAIAYSWDGLYLGDSVVLDHQDYIAFFSVTYLAPSDGIRSDFGDVLQTLEFF